MQFSEMLTCALVVCTCMKIGDNEWIINLSNYRSLLQNIVSFVGLFCKTMTLSLAKQGRTWSSRKEIWGCDEGWCVCWFVTICIYIYIYNIYIYKYIYTYSLYICMYKYINMSMQTHSICIDICVYIFIHIYVYVYLYTRTHTQAHTYTHMSIHPHVYLHPWDCSQTISRGDSNWHVWCVCMYMHICIYI